MCFVKELFTKPRVAEEDITVYKMLSYSKGATFGPYTNHPYFKIKNAPDDFRVKAELDPDHESQCILEQGIHSYTDLATAEQYLHYKYNRQVYKAYIPKGATYYLNEALCEAISTELVVLTKSID